MASDLDGHRARCSGALQIPHRCAPEITKETTWQRLPRPRRRPSPSEPAAGLAGANPTAELREEVVHDTPELALKGVDALDLARQGVSTKYAERLA